MDDDLSLDHCSTYVVVNSAESKGPATLTELGRELISPPSGNERDSLP